MVRPIAIVGAPWGWEAARIAGIESVNTLFHGLDWGRTFFLGWSDRVPAWFIDRVEAINFHCTTLPYGRGGHPIENLILRGHQTTAITAHQMTSELDAGPIYGVSDPISLAGTKADIHARFVTPVAALMRWICETNPIPQPQVGEPTYFRRLSDEDYRAFWAGRG